MKKLIILLIASFAIPSCKDEPKVTASLICNVQNPIEDLTWLSNILNNKTDCKIYSGASLYSYVYNNATVFYLQNPLSSHGICVESVYDCNGSSLFSWIDESEWSNFKAKRTNEKLIWKN